MTNFQRLIHSRGLDERLFNNTQEYFAVFFSIHQMYKKLKDIGEYTCGSMLDYKHSAGICFKFDDHGTLILMGVYQPQGEGDSNAAKVLLAVVLMLYEQFMLVVKKPDDPKEKVPCLVRFEFQSKEDYGNLLNVISEYLTASEMGRVMKKY